jgi:hypothetical protein
MIKEWKTVRQRKRVMQKKKSNIDMICVISWSELFSGNNYCMRGIILIFGHIITS